jgi:16S rRNA (cytosine967-C5)-methyltransferase
MTPARLAAMRVLVAIDAGRTTLSAEVERERPDFADRRDQGLFLELATGTTRWRAEIDARLAAHCRRPLADLTPELRAILRLAAYQLHHLDRIPEHAIVNESVELTRAVQQSRAAGFVNGVLRNLVRARAKPSGLPPRPADPLDQDAALDYLSVTLSHPRWLVARWLTRVGFEACERWCRFNNTPPEVTLRPQGISADDLVVLLREDDVEATVGQFAGGAVRLPAGALGRVSSYTQHLFSVQDEGSQLVAGAVGAKPGDVVLDVCAAPGGKTVLINQSIQPRGRVIGGDLRLRRVKLLRTTLLRANVAPRVLSLNAETGLPFRAIFDRVFLDAPCSGLGTIRRDPDIKWHREADDLARLAAAQLRMLHCSAAVVRPGGALIYATCSSEPEENEGVIDQFLSQNAAFKLVPIQPPAGLPVETPLVDARGMLRTLPFAHGLDAFFAAMLVRRDAA